MADRSRSTGEDFNEGSKYSEALPGLLPHVAVVADNAVREAGRNLRGLLLAQRDIPPHQPHI